MKKTKKIILIDANSLIYRAFFALPTSLKTKSGLITNAVYGFTSMLIRLIKQEKPDVIIAAFDKATKTFRHEKYKEYKANRLAMPDELRPQIPLAKEVLSAFDIPVLEVEGFEADDILATLSKQVGRGEEVFILTADRDLLQVINERVKVLSTRRGVTDIKLYDKKTAKERFGLPPEKMVDVLGLMGEPTDNIPGIPGIGEKTAVKLIKEFGKLEKVFDNLAKIPGKKVKYLLETYKDQALLSKQLAILRTDVPIDLKNFSKKFQVNKDKLTDLFTELEFQTLLKRLEIKEEKPLKIKEPVSLKIIKIQSEQELNNWVDKIIKKGEVGISIQTEGGILDGGILSLTIALSENEIGFVPLDGFNKAFFTPTLNQLLTSKDVIKIIFDLKNIYHFLSNSDIELTPPFFDILLASYLLHPDRGKYGFNSLIEFYSGLEINKTEKEEKRDLSCSFLFPLYNYLNNELKKENLMDVFKQIEIPLSPILAKMEKRGVRINPEIFFSLSKEIEKLLQKVEEDIYGLAGIEFNINSPQQVSKILFEKLKLETGKKRKKAYATDFSALIKIASSHPIIDKILTFRELSKLKTTYLDVLPGLVNKKTGRIHTDFKITGTATGRLSSVNPNLQNIPVRGRWANRIREGFIPEEGNILISCDYSQIDLRVLAHLSGDKNLLDAFQNNLDIHVATASEVFSIKKDKVDQKMRRAAKAVNFGIVYGISPFGLAEQLKIEQDEAKEYIEKYFKRYPEVKEYIKNIIAEGYQNGFVATLFGRRRYLPQLKSTNEKIKNFGERLAVNSPIQGTSADLIKMAMIEIFKKFQKETLKTEMILQVHDELIFESPLEEKKKVIKIAKEVMEKIYPLKSGLSVSVSSGNNWAELSKK